jgi:hypothetical protein
MSLVFQIPGWETVSGLFVGTDMTCRNPFNVIKRDPYLGVSLPALPTRFFQISAGELDSSFGGTIPNERFERIEITTEDRKARLIHSIIGQALLENGDNKGYKRRLKW